MIVSQDVTESLGYVAKLDHLPGAQASVPAMSAKREQFSTEFS